MGRGPEIERRQHTDVPAVQEGEGVQGRAAHICDGCLAYR